MKPSKDVLAKINPKKLEAQKKFFTVPAWTTLPHPGWFIEVQKDGKIVDHLDLDSSPYFLFGRAKEVVDYPLQHETISRVHCALVHRYPQMGVIDLGSHHGTVVDGVRLAPKKESFITDGSKIVFGGSSRVHIVRHNPDQKAEYERRHEKRKSERREARHEHDDDEPLEKKHKRDLGIMAIGHKPAEKGKEKEAERVIRKSSHAVNVAHILLKHDKVRKPVDKSGMPIKRTKTEAYKELSDIRQKILLNIDGEGIWPAFQKWAKKRSECNSQELGGLLERGQTHRDFEDAAFRLNVGELSEVISTPAGEHLIYRLADVAHAEEAKASFSHD